jgi:hypothetical protein
VMVAPDLVHSGIFSIGTFRKSGRSVPQRRQ